MNFRHPVFAFVMILLIFGGTYATGRFVFNLHFSNLRSLKGSKEPRELRQFACLFRDGRVSRSEFCQLFHDDPSFSKLIERASTAFHIPYSVLFCTVLIESGFNPNAKSGRNFGYGQFSELSVKQLRHLLTENKYSYKPMWKDYTDAPIKRVTPQFVMFSEDPEIPLGAIALYVRWIFDRIDQLNCLGCGPEFLITDKKLALMIAGYNWSPFKIRRIASLSIPEMLDPKSSPLPEISRRYIRSMKYCRDSAEFESFRRGHHPQDKRIRKCKQPCFQEP